MSEHLNAADRMGTGLQEAATTVPVCPACGSDELRVAYDTVVTQRVREWSVEAEGPLQPRWTAIEYSADIDVDVEGGDNHRLECRNCLYDGNPAVEGDTDTFVLVAPVTLTEKIRKALGDLGVPYTEELVQAIAAMTEPTPATAR